MKTKIINIFITLILSLSYSLHAVFIPLDTFEDGIISETKTIDIPGLQFAYNPSIVKYKKGFLLTFRVDSGPRFKRPTKIGLIKLNKAFKPISAPQLLSLPSIRSIDNENHQDPRIIEVRGELYITFYEKWFDSGVKHAEMQLCKINEKNGLFTAFDVIQLSIPQNFPCQRQEKNWVPFAYKNTLYFGYSLQPHKIIVPNLLTGDSIEFGQSSMKNDWAWGKLRGGTPALLIDGHYLAFFHSSRVGTSQFSSQKRKYYFMGAYTFSPNPPFQLEQISPTPLVGAEFYSNEPDIHDSQSNRRKKILHVIFPGGFVFDEENFYVVYGKDDCAIEVAVINKQKLYNSLVPVSQIP